MSNEPRDFTFALQPSLRPPFQAESDEHAEVRWYPQPDGSVVRMVIWKPKPYPDPARRVIVPGLNEANE